MANITLAMRIKSEIASHMNIGEFDPQTEYWTSYSEILKEYFTANDPLPRVEDLFATLARGKSLSYT